MKRLFLFLFVLSTINVHTAEKPKLVVLIVLDQVPYEYIARFQPYFGKDGFNYLINNGASFADAEYRYAYTKTACGHATIATGTYSHINGIVGNAWYDRGKNKRVNCVDDETEQLLGSSGTGRSPRSLLVQTLGDVLRDQTHNSSKVISISNKDRSAILMGGHSGIAYWIEDTTFVTSTYYMKSFPSWVTEFNRSGIFEKYFGNVWSELQPAIANKICDSDDVPYEDNPSGMGRAFPHRIVGTDSSRRTHSYYDALDHSPFSTDIMLSFARTAIERESLAARGTTDMLCVDIATPDIVGHSYGPNSHEIFDLMLRTDVQLAEFFSYLDKRVGLRNCVIALSADHGIAPIPEYKRKMSPEVNAVRISTKEITSRANEILNNAFGKPSTPWVAQTVDATIYLNDEALKEKGIAQTTARTTLKDSLANHFPIDKAYTADELLGKTEEDCFCRNVQLSFYPPRSGDVMFLVQPFSIIDGSPTGTNHGMPYTYDTHVPLMFAGYGIAHGEFNVQVSPIDLAPTLAKVLGLQMPKECEGKVLKEVLKK